jgi:hypothetical protein
MSTFRQVVDEEEQETQEFKTAREAFTAPTFFIQLCVPLSGPVSHGVTRAASPPPARSSPPPSLPLSCHSCITMAINFGINFGWEWASLSGWGNKQDKAAWPGIPVWGLNNAAGSCLALDMPLTTFLIGFMCSLLGTGGTQKEVRERKCKMLASHVCEGGWWRYTPVKVRNLCNRSLCVGLFVTALIGAPSFLLAWAVVGGGLFAGYEYTIFKALWATFVSAVVYTLVYPAAIDRFYFSDLLFEDLHKKATRLNVPPLVAQPALI